MTEELKVQVPDIGDFSDVDIIEVAVAVGDKVSAEDTLITLETEKAAMDVPAPADGEVVAVLVAEGGTVSQGDHIVTLKVVAGASASETKEESSPESSGKKP
ncbi:MAG: hypothetical protein P8R04_02955, partial [Gammaproteobacteria bacterium]|nr:hypothetical protein [Gammaproteobacteria bacterium]